MRALCLLPLLIPSLALAQPSALPSASAFNGWSDNAVYDDQVMDFAKAPSAILCDGPSLYPAHPQQDLKRYNGGVSGDYDLRKLRGGDAACLTPLPINGQGVSYCVRGDVANDVVLSDIFDDGCGHIVRAFVEVQFMTSEESMGTLVSPGRTMYPDPKSDYAGDMIAGGTYAVPRAKFLKITPATPAEVAKSKSLQAQALAKGFSFSASTRLYAEPSH